MPSYFLDVQKSSSVACPGARHVHIGLGGTSAQVCSLSMAVTVLFSVWLTLPYTVRHAGGF